MALLSTLASLSVISREPTALLARDYALPMRPDFKFTYFFGDELTRDNIEKRLCIRLTSQDLANMDPGPMAHGQPNEIQKKAGLYCAPVLIDVGCQHCGTNSLWTFVMAHPAFAMNGTYNEVEPVKERHFFTAEHWAGTSEPPVPPLEWKGGQGGKRHYFAVFARSPVLGFDCSSDCNLIPIASTVQAMLPHVKVLMHLRRQADRLMSELGISSSKNFDDRIAQDHSLLEYKDHLCPVQAVEDFQHGLSARQVLYIDSQMLFLHRDAVMQEVFAFVGVPMASLPPEVVTNCKEDRYSDWQEGSGCFNGTSRVSTSALSQIQPAYEECNVKLAELLKIRRESLYPQDPMPNGLPPPASTAPKALEDGSIVDPTASKMSMHHIEDCNLCGVDWCKKVDQGECVNFSPNDGTHALGPGISEVGCDALEDTTPYCIDGSDAIYGVGKPRSERT